MAIELRATHEDDLDYILQAERDPANSPYILAWTRQQHQNALLDGDQRHFIVTDIQTKRAVGFVILAGLNNRHDAIEFRRLVITDKGQGYGRLAIRAVKAYAFEQQQAHRLWIDVFDFNELAQYLYQLEGFVIEGTWRECVRMGDNYHSLVFMAILRHEYEKNG